MLHLYDYTTPRVERLRQKLISTRRIRKLHGSTLTMKTEFVFFFREGGGQLEIFSLSHLNVIST